MIAMNSSVAPYVSVPTWEDYVALEMSIIPIPHRAKHPDYRWGRLSYTNTHCLLDSESGTRTLRKFFELGGDGLAVICGRPSENLFVIDCESIEALDNIRRELVARDIDAPCVYSSRGGHFYLRSREGAVKGVRSGQMDDVEIRGDGDLVVLPPTIHASGVVYRWVSGGPPRNIPTVSVSDLDFFPFALVTSGVVSRRLHDDTRDYLAHGADIGTRNNRLFDAARDYVYVGKDKIAAFADLLPIAVRGGLDERESAATILSAFKKPHPLAPSPKRQGGGIETSQTDVLWTFAASVRWDGRTGGTDKAVFGALVRRRAEDAQRHTDGKFRAAYRELMLITGIKSHHTLRRSIQRLMGCGYIERGGNEENGSSLWRFSDMVMQAGVFFACNTATLTQQFSLRSNYCGNHAHLTQSAAAIIKLLREKAIGMTTSDITSAIGCHRTTTQRNLLKLVDAGLVESDGDCYRAAAVPMGYDEQLAAESKRYAVDVERQAKFTRERAMFALDPIVKFLWTKNKKGESV